MSRSKRAILLAAMALILGSVAAANVAKRERQVEAQLGGYVKVAVANQNIAAGTQIKPDQLALKSIPRRYMPIDAEPSAELFVGAQLAVDLSKGSYLTQNLLAVDGEAASDDTAVVGKGERIVDLIASGSLQSIQESGRVDILVTRGEGDAGRTVIALEAVKVLSVQEAGDDSQASAEAGQRVAVTLKVKLKQALYLTAAQNFAREIRLLPRATNDSSRGRSGLGISSDSL